MSPLRLFFSKLSEDWFVIYCTTTWRKWAIYIFRLKVKVEHVLELNMKVIDCEKLDLLQDNSVNCHPLQTNFCLLKPNRIKFKLHVLRAKKVGGALLCFWFGRLAEVLPSGLLTAQQFIGIVEVSTFNKLKASKKYQERVRCLIVPNVR